MRDLINEFATQYVADLQRQLDSGYGQRSLQNPVLFLFIGDKSVEALRAVCASNERDWQNSRGVLYMHAYQEKTWEHPQVLGCRLPQADADKKTMRSSVHERFVEDEASKMELNKAMKLASVRIAETGKLFSAFQQVNIAVVTRADDPAAILLPELTLLLKSYLNELFKNVSADLYVLLQERNNGEAFGFSAALSVSFLEELNRYQRSDYSYRANLLVTEDLVKLPVEHEKAPLFSIAYLLSDKTEHGLFLEGGMQENYELISKLVLLNNKQAEHEFSEGNEGYNKLQFIRNIAGDGGQTRFASAGLSKVKRPTHAIALTVLAAVFDRYWERLKEGELVPKTKAREKLGLSAHELERKMAAIMPEPHMLEEMTGLMTSGVSYSELSGMTMREAELALFDGSSQAFFETNMASVAKERLERLLVQEPLADLIQDRVMADERFGLYAAYQLTAEHANGANLLDELRTGIREAARQVELIRAELAELYQQRVDRQDIRVGGFFTRDKERVRTLVRHLLHVVYEKKLELLEWELLHALLVDYERQTEVIHRQISEQVDQLEGLQKQLREIAQASVREATDYLGKNVDEYYESVVRDTMRSLEAAKGSGFYMEQRYIGSGALLFQNRIAGLVERLCQFCRNEILTRSPFALSFEAELLARANVGAAYDNRSVLTREDLFFDLSQVLEQRAAVHMEVFHFLQKHRYEEKYLFADIHNDFVQYVLRKDEGIRTYKQGCIHEEQKSGIEKMNLMGGFGMEDLMFYRNNKKYHASYVESGFVFDRAGEEGAS
ncbi:hypothetical protein [Brevibacillus agri]|uniref:hypothetical protein n=1 Tax=Brevibacillus agri TaxID=51101 RepID=UPI00046EB0E3|nr:hypothetical protein [Brevibacillus agri]MBY0052133.1 hypothetical protein [Brevibacillus agri]MCG5251070.1 hypothetical protein [Brevibacillus agri]MDR9504992.1 hypothetical protein [Brevibacillus agri]